MDKLCYKCANAELADIVRLVDAPPAAAPTSEKVVLHDARSNFNPIASFLVGHGHFQAVHKLWNIVDNTLAAVRADVETANIDRDTALVRAEYERGRADGRADATAPLPEVTALDAAHDAFLAHPDIAPYVASLPRIRWALEAALRAARQGGGQ